MNGSSSSLKGSGVFLRGGRTVLAKGASFRAPKKDSRPRTRGSVLLLVLVVVAMFTLSAFAFFDLMFNYRQATDTYGSKLQATAAAESGVEFLMNHLKKTPLEVQTAGGLYNNPAWFQGVLLADDPDPRYRARFTILAPAMLDGISGDVRFGLENESARINLNTLLMLEEQEEGTARDLLLNLPGMTEYIADAILDWLDEDDEIRMFGAELADYSALDPPYMPANGPLTTIEELLLVKGVTPELLYGADLNRNFYIDEDEVARQNLAAADNMDGSMNRGWSAFFTLHSAESNTREDGTPKIDVNADDLETLHQDLLAAGLTDAEANFIIAFRQGGPEEEENQGRGRGRGRGGDDENEENDDEDGDNQGGNRDGEEDGDDEGESGDGDGGRGGDGGGGRGGGGGGGGGQDQQPPREVEADAIEIDFETQGQNRLTSILDLIGTNTRITPADESEEVIVTTPFGDDPGEMADYLPKLMENLTVNSGPIAGRININQAPSAVLYGLPGLRPDAVDQILATRDPEVLPNRPERAYETWILTEGIVTLDEMKELMKYVTAGGDVYRAQVVGFFDQQDSPTRRMEMIIDNTTFGSPAMVFLRDLTQLGGGFTPAVLGTGAAVAP